MTEGGGGVEKCPNLRDVIYEWSLSFFAPYRACIIPALVSTYRSRSSLGPLLSWEFGPRALHCTAERYDLSEVEVPLVALEKSNKILGTNDNFIKQGLKTDLIALCI